MADKHERDQGLDGRSETKWLMQGRNCVAGEIAEICQPFKLALFRAFLLLPLHSFAFFEASYFEYCFEALRFYRMAEARTVSMPPAYAAASFSASSSLPSTQLCGCFGSLVGILHEFWPCCGGSQSVCSAVAIAGPPPNTPLYSGNEARGINLDNQDG